MSDMEIGILKGFDIGMSIEVEYENPRENSGSIHLNLVQDDFNYFLHFNPRWGSSKVLILNSKQAGGFEKEVRLHGYNFALGQRVRIKFVAESTQLRVFQNDEHLGNFDYRMPCSTVKKVKFSWKGNAAKAPKLIALRIGYP